MKKYVTKEKEKSLTVDAGWYTEQEMKDKLGYDAKTIKKIVDYTAKNLSVLQRKWKYDETIIQHWVETSWSGQLVHKDNEKSVHEEEQEAKDTPNPSLSFENGGNQTNPGSAAAGANEGDDPRAALERAWSEMLSKTNKLRDNVNLLQNCDMSDVQKRHADSMLKHADAMEQHYDKMSMLKATANIRLSEKLKDEIMIALDAASVLTLASINGPLMSRIPSLALFLLGLFLGRGLDRGPRSVFASGTHLNVCEYHLLRSIWEDGPGSCEAARQRSLGPPNSGDLLKFASSNMADHGQQAVPAVHWKYHKYFDAEIRALPRLCELWHQLLANKQIFKIALPDTSLPKSPGAVFRAAEQMMDVVLTGTSVAAYKIGFTHATGKTVSAFARASCSRERGQDAVLDSLAKTSENRLEDKSHEVFKHYGLALDIPISYVDVGDAKKNMPWIKPTDLFQHLADLGKLDLLYAEQDTSVLTQLPRPISGVQWFWARFAVLEPGNTINDCFDSGLCVPERTIPLLLHGDEARSKKHLPMMVANTHAMIGYGCKAYKNWFAEAPLSKKQAGGVNLEGAVQKTRFLHFVMQKKDYGEDAQHLDKMFDALAIDLAKLQTEGIKVNGERWHLVVIAAVGDWQFFAKVGHLNRCYTHVSKRSGQKTLNGICHLCLAGTHGCPTWEDFVDSPTWRPTCGTLEPWEQTPSLIRRLHVNVANRVSFFQPDFWHCLHLGAGKNLVASAVAEWLRVVPGANIGERFCFIDDAAQAWLRSRNDKLYCKCISAVTMGIDSLQKVPNAGWQKASDTTLLLEFLEHFCSVNAGLANADPILRWTWVAASNINLAVRMLYRGGLWLDQSTAHTVARCGLNFLKSYGHLVAMTLAADRDRFPVTPKLHILHHLFLHLQENASRCSWTLSFLGYSVQQDETFVGIQGRASRRVGPQHAALRVLQRYLADAAEHLTPEFRLAAKKFEGAEGPEQTRSLKRPRTHHW
ncbi:unnamed protein product [Symbiodinium sp. CCMP2592]|nr:unnamed protein product [Symbiodinium sp. CCMP2592]